MSVQLQKLIRPITSSRFALPTHPIPSQVLDRMNVTSLWYIYIFPRYPESLRAPRPLGHQLRESSDHLFLSCPVCGHQRVYP